MKSWTEEESCKLFLSNLAVSIHIRFILQWSNIENNFIVVIHYSPFLLHCWIFTNVIFAWSWDTFILSFKVKHKKWQRSFWPLAIFICKNKTFSWTDNLRSTIFHQLIKLTRDTLLLYLHYIYTFVIDK